MFEANCLKEKPADIVARVLKEKTPCFLSARKGEQGVLIPLGGFMDEVLERHPQIMDATMKDLKKGTEMPLYCMQVGLSKGRDAIRFLDGRDRPVLGLVSIKRFVHWLEEDEDPPAPKRKAPARKKVTKRKKAATQPRKRMGQP
ncbi:hypothetical protein [Hyalangium versicolor]|uniref:hypothetical protein n=1 Tax=Hyalangium versicolor TaxID=2861190 RepID=UPI001CCF3EB0|nr:hypothetical protein [Hyalangium versicolor]